MTGFDTAKDAALRIAEQAVGECDRLRKEHAEMREFLEYAGAALEIGGYPKMAAKAAELLTRIGGAK